MFNELTKHIKDNEIDIAFLKQLLNQKLSIAEIIDFSDSAADLNSRLNDFDQGYSHYTLLALRAINEILGNFGIAQASDGSFYSVSESNLTVFLIEGEFVIKELT